MCIEQLTQHLIGNTFVEQETPFIGNQIGGYNLVDKTWVKHSSELQLRNKWRRDPISFLILFASTPATSCFVCPVVGSNKQRPISASKRIRESVK